jgi:excinuclease ABC subunit A
MEGSKELPIVIRGAREHNLQNVDLTLQRNQLICFTGVSGSGKSSLAFDTLYAEGQRRYLESLSTYARQFVGQLPKPDVDYLSGLSPAISISQKSTGNNPRSTVGTITEIHDFLRVLFSRVGTGFCPKCDVEIASQTRDQIVERVSTLPAGPVYHFLAPIVRGQKGEYRDLFDDLRKQGFNRARVDGEVFSLDSVPVLDRYSKHNIEVVIDRIVLKDVSRQRIAEAIDIGLRLGEGTLLLAFSDLSTGAKQPAQESPDEPTKGAAPKKRAAKKKAKSKDGDIDTGASPTQSIDIAASEAPQGRVIFDPRADIIFSSSYACAKCGCSYQPPSPQLLSFNSPQGACQTCEGLGESFTFDPALLVTKPSKSIKNGAIELIGKQTEMTRWYRRSISLFAGVIEAREELPIGRLITTPWEELQPNEQRWMLYGYHGMSVKAKGRASHGEDYDGIIPELMNAYRSAKNPIMRKQYEKYMQITTCDSCQGAKLNCQARSIRLRTRAPRFAAEAWLSIDQFSRLTVSECSEFMSALELSELQWTIGREAIKEVRARLQFLEDVGLGYLSLDRTAPTLSGGESQRIRLASQIGSGLVGVMYVLDEPSIGLHPRDNDRLLSSLTRLRNLGNTLIVVEHDEDTIRLADTVVDFGPGPGVKGGQLIASGTVEDISGNPESVTGGFLSGSRTIRSPEVRRPTDGKRLVIRNAQHNNLKGIDVEFSLGCFVAVTGVSGSGKSSLVTDILSPALRMQLHNAEQKPGDHGSIEGIELVDKIIDIDQSPIGRTPRSNPATYVKVFDAIRELFAELPEAKRRGFTSSTFSFNTDAGRCSACEGHGANRIDMEVLADLWVPCAACEGKRYSRPVLQVEFKGKSIADCLDLDVQQALVHFEAFPKIVDKLQTLSGVGLDYLKLGQPSPTLSGGEAQRIKLSKELSRRSTGKTIYVLDEPTTGLHFYDIDLLLGVLQSLVDLGNTVIVVEHNLDLIQAADWVIDLGPEGGADGGRVVCSGTPEEVAGNRQSYTGIALAKYFAKHQAASKAKKGSPKKKNVKAKDGSLTVVRPEEPFEQMQDIHVLGARQHNLKDVEITLPRNQMTVFCGHSGSGKSSMAMDTIYAEGQRRFVESLSPYVRQFVGQMPKAAVERVDGLSPSIAIEQRNLSHTPRSTVGTVTEIYDYFRVVFARLGQMHCTQCDSPVGTQTSDEIIERILGQAKSKNGRALLVAPVSMNGSVTQEHFLQQFKQQGFVRVRINGKTYEIDVAPPLQLKSRNEIQIVVDRLQWDKLERKRLTDSVSTALTVGNGVLQIVDVDESRPEIFWDVDTHSLLLACNKCGISFQPISPHSFSFNTSIGWCEDCKGIGTQTGTNPSAVLDMDRSANDGGILLWPDLTLPLSRAMLKAFCRETTIDPSVPLGSLPVSKRSILLNGLQNRMVNVLRQDLESVGADEKELRGLENDRSVYFSFEYKGCFPAIDRNQSALVGITRGMDIDWQAEGPCPACSGARVRPEAAFTRFRDQSIRDIVHLPIGELLESVKSWKLSVREKKIAGELHREITERLKFLVDVGLEYLNLDRAANTLSGGESQRIRLASQLGSGLSGVLYVLDEPTIGLHPRDNLRLINAIKSLRNLGNTLLVVEHDREVIQSSDMLCDFGPGSGSLGGKIVAQGTPAQIICDPESVTGPFLSGVRVINTERNSRITLQNGPDSAAICHDWSAEATPPKGWLKIVGARANSLKNIDVSIPLGCFCVVTGPSGSGKSTLINNILYRALCKYTYRHIGTPGAHDRVEGMQLVNKVLRVDQSPLGMSPSSNPATYIGVFDHIRDWFAKLPEAQSRGMRPSHFSFNVPNGRCEKCEGMGQICIPMHFLPDVWIECDACNGKRFTEEVLAVKYRGKNISDILSMSIREVRELLSEIPRVEKMLGVLCDVGLDYLSLGQSAPTLSGGEAQRVKLAAELCRPATGNTLYLFDEPTTGLHFDDIQKLLNVFQSLIEHGNSVVVIEHNLDVIKTADWVIDMGPEAGHLGGHVVFAGPPDNLVDYAQNYSYNAANDPGLKVAEPNATIKPKSRKKTTSQDSSIVQFPLNTTLHRSYTGEALAKFKSELPVVPILVMETSKNSTAKPSRVKKKGTKKSPVKNNAAPKKKR